MAETHKTLVYNIRISQGSAATRLRYGGNFNKSFTANCPQSAPVKELLKSVSIWQRYGQMFDGTFFMDHGINSSQRK